MNPIHIIGGGLAGSEAAWQCARAGVPVILHEMRGPHKTDAHHTDRLAEPVCSNSFRSDDPNNNAVGLIHQEIRALGSLIMHANRMARARRIADPVSPNPAISIAQLAGSGTAGRLSEPLKVPL